MNTKGFLSIILFFIMLLLFTGCATNEEQSTEPNPPQTDDLKQGTEIPNAENQMSIYPRNGEEIVLANDGGYNWWKNYNTDNPVPNGGYSYADVYFPNPLTLSWQENKNADYYDVFISSDKNFSEDKTEIYVVLDLSPYMVFGTKKELKSVSASKIASLIGWQSLANKDRFGVVLYDGEKEYTGMWGPKTSGDTNS